MLINVSKKAFRSYILFLMFFYLIIFRDLLELFIPFLGYADEICGLLLFPILLALLIKNGGVIQIKKGFLRRMKIPIFLLLFITFGFVGNLIFQYQPLYKAALPDLFLNLKFWMSIYVAYVLFEKLDLEIFGSRIGNHVKFVTILFIALIILDYVFNLFDGDIRYGLKSTTLFYGIHTAFAAMCGFLISLLTLVRKYVRGANLFTVLLLILLASTLRSKAFGSVVLFIVLYAIVKVLKVKIKAWHIVVLAAICLFIGWTQIQYYFFSDISAGAARNVLTRNCFIVAKDHFPFGSGFATYGSYFSGVHYSPLYAKYGMADIHGLMESHLSFISDTFWPMIIAQSGYLGAAAFVAALVALFFEVQKVSKTDKDYYLAGLFALAYLCVSSFAESAFVSPNAIPLAIVIGIALKQAKMKKNQALKEVESK